MRVLKRRRSAEQPQRERNTISGDYSKRDPPVPIPNTEVKPLSADGTWLATARESKTSPDSIRHSVVITRWGAFFLYNRSFGVRRDVPRGICDGEKAKQSYNFLTNSLDRSGFILYTKAVVFCEIRVFQTHN